METSDFILDTLERLQSVVTVAVNGLSHEELTWQPGAEANSIGFILWHQTRAEDVLIHDWIQQKPQVWVTEQWYQRLKLPENPHDNGWGYTTEQIAAFPVPELKELLGYAKATRTQTIDYLKNATADKLEQAIQTPLGELTIGQTLALTLCEIAEHTGQIAYLRGLQRGLDK
ncbi:MAG: DinB family protein [Dehalococcoidales bacterium]|nr:MAG: DinB family protein [Dehalococcoidales bacterium]